MSNRETGTVKWFDDAKGCGFVSRENGEDCSCTSAQSSRRASKSLQEGQAQLHRRRGPERTCRLTTLSMHSESLPR
ncbi:MAG: cold shock domain-containing protein [Gammaproteobacteria bacterium]